MRSNALIFGNRKEKVKIPSYGASKNGALEDSFKSLVVRKPKGMTFDTVT